MPTMDRYAATPTYIGHVSRLTSEIASLETEHVRLSNIRLYSKIENRKRTPDEQRLLLNVKSRLKTRRCKLTRVENLNLPPWDLLHMIMEADGTCWNNVAQAEKWHKELASHEGRGEASLRDWYQLPEKPSSAKDIDLPEVGVEAKNVQGRRGDGKFALQTIQAGSSGRQCYSMWMGRSAEAALFKGLPDETRQALFTGEVTRPLIYARLSNEVRTSLLAAVKPSVVFREPLAIDCITRNGFLHISKDDFDAAWSTECVTKCGPKYALRKSYLLDRLLRLSAIQHVSNEAA